MFMPRQLLTIVSILEEVRAAAAKARTELPPEPAEAVAVYLALIVSKVVNYNSVNTFWDYTRKKLAKTFSRHDFTFRPAFGEFEGARETVMWGASQVINAYTQLAGLIHGEAVSLEGGDEEGGDEESAANTAADEVETDEAGEKSPDVPLPESDIHLRPEVIVPTITNNDAAALDTPAPGTVHLICVDPPYYNNIQYAELSNFFYVWLKRALGDWTGLEHLFREELAETNREAVANAIRWKDEAERDQAEWQAKFQAALEKRADARGANGRKLPVAERRKRAATLAGPEPLTATERAERFYEGKMAAVFRRARQLLHPAGRMVVMFNHKMTKAWRALGKALIEAGFEIRTSIPIHTEAESSLNIRGYDAARSTVLLLCLPREQSAQVTGNWDRVQRRIDEVARNAAAHFQTQGIFGTDLYLSALGPTLGEVGKHWPITRLNGQAVDLGEALEKAYGAVGRFRLEQILAELSAKAAGAVENFSADTADRNTQALWLWLDTFQGDIADSDDVRKLAKSLDIEPDTFRKLKLIEVESDTFSLKAPQEIDLNQLARQLAGEKVARGRTAREADVWEERKFVNFLGAAVWNAIALMIGGDEMVRGVEPLKRWLRGSSYGTSPEFRGAFAVTLHLLEQAFGKWREDDPWKKATIEARRAWDLVVRDWRG
jgi:adenine-specific DNA methylase